MKNASHQNTIEPQINIQKKAMKKSSAIDLHNLFVDELKDIYGAEKALVITISKLITNATSTKLVESLTGHLEATQEHVIRLEDVFLAIDEQVRAKKCEAMEGLIREAESILNNTVDGTARDEGIILACQKIEHYEICGWAQQGR